jgi:hypothetical protein
VGEEKAAVVVDCRFLARSLMADDAVHVRFAGHMEERGTNAAGWIVDLSLGYARSRRKLAREKRFFFLFLR